MFTSAAAVTASVLVSSQLQQSEAHAASSAFSLPPLPYSRTALQPHVSAETIDFHHGKHHQVIISGAKPLPHDISSFPLPLDDQLTTMASANPAFT